MSSHSYHFITYWEVVASPEEVYRVLEDVNTLPLWWPSVYLKVEILEPGEPGGVGKVVALHTKGWLPYTLKWKFRTTKADFPHGFALEAWGDFVGKGVWSFKQQPGSKICEISYDWRIDAEKPLLKYFSFLLKPVFSANHHWAMRKGEESLKLELLRRRAGTDKELAAIAPPP